MQVSDEIASKMQYESASAVVDVLSDIILFGDETNDINNQIAILRENAIKKGKRDIFERSFSVCMKSEVIRDCIQQKHLNIRLTYTKEDFIASETPYREIFEITNPFERQQRFLQVADNAKSVGATSFAKTYKEFERQMRMVNTGGDPNKMNPTMFPEQPLELDGGEWTCDVTGVRRITGSGEEVACCHPIMPVERLVNIDTGEEKLKIAYSKGRRWRYAVYGKDVLFVANKITQLASIGIAVTSENAKLLVRYLCDVENKNYEILPERNSVGRLGYVGTDHIFSPYQPNLIFDGDAGYSALYRAMTSHGDEETWKRMAIECRKNSCTLQILLAASFGSVLIHSLGALPFFVHLWGVESGTGKTVALMLAASVWGDPTIGRYVQTFNATQVGHEKTAAFLNNIPLCIDELQLSKDSHGKSRFDVYQLAQGTGRTRGNKAGGVDRTPEWSLCILTTGESPIVQNGAGAGAVNRVIDIECKASEAVVADGITVSANVKQNYGHAGKRFVERLTDGKISEAKAYYTAQFKQLSTRDTTEKQAMSAALILTADKLADELIFQTGKYLTADEIASFLQTKSSVSAGERGYQYMCDWVAMNANKFAADNVNGDVYGLLENGWAFINSSVFRSAAQDAGYDSRALLSWLKTHGLILTRGKRMTRGKRIHGVNTECVVMKIHGDSEDDSGMPTDSIESDMDELL